MQMQMDFFRFSWRPSGGKSIGASYAIRLNKANDLAVMLYSLYGVFHELLMRTG